MLEVNLERRPLATEKVAYETAEGGQGVFGIALGRVWREVEGSLAELPSERADGADDDAAGPAAAKADELSRRRARKTG